MHVSVDEFDYTYSDHNGNMIQECIHKGVMAFDGRVIAKSIMSLSMGKEFDILLYMHMSLSMSLIILIAITMAI